MKLCSHLWMPLLLACVMPATWCTTASPAPDTLSLNQLEQRLAAIDSELAQLAHLTLRGGVGNLGWFSAGHPRKQNKQWVQIPLPENSVIDQIVLTPVIWRDNQAGYQSDGFPLEFDVIIGDGTDQTGTTIASFNSDDQLLPRIAPLVISCAPTPARWVKIVAKPERSKVWDDKFHVQLSEVFIFSGEENLALNQPVHASSNQTNMVKRAMQKEALVDGLTPYLMDSAEGAKSAPYIAFYRYGNDLSFTIDLGRAVPIDEVHLHAADIRENVPRIHHSNYGMPKQLEIEGALTADFSDAIPLASYAHTTVYEAGPLVMLRFPATTCRYIRLTATQGYGAPEAFGLARCFGLAEIELMSQGQNVAHGKTVTASTDTMRVQGKLSNLTDGRNHFGNILPLKAWLNQLARRHDLQVERPLVVAALNDHYSRQKQNLRIMYGVAALLTIATFLTILIYRIISMRQVAQLKQRFAADLHDELGANLHSIGLISDVAEDAQSPEEWRTLTERIRELTERTSTAVRHCTNMLESKDLYIGLAADMRRSADRIATNVAHQLTIEGEEHLDRLKPRTRVDLFLFYKECLVNICRHSGATQVTTRLVARPTQTILTIRDNGRGLGEVGTPSEIPKSLQRRANLLQAKLNVTSPSSGGTTVELLLKKRRRWMELF